MYAGAKEAEAQLENSFTLLKGHALSMLCASASLYLLQMTSCIPSYLAHTGAQPETGWRSNCATHCCIIPPIFIGPAAERAVQNNPSSAQGNAPNARRNINDWLSKDLFHIQPGNLQWSDCKPHCYEAKWSTQTTLKPHNTKYYSQISCN